MATQRTQRIGIWIIAIVLTVGTIGSFVVIVLSNQNSQTAQNQINEESQKYQAAVTAQTNQLSKQYFSEFSQYSSQVAPFAASSVKTLTTQDLKIGTTGDALTTSSSFTAYYIGWNPSGTIFDSSISGDSLKAPLTATPGGVITGWTNGVVGMKIGGVRVLSIPSADAYGSAGSGSTIPPNTPLKFVIMIVPTPPTIPIPADLEQYYEQQQESSAAQ